MTTAELVLKLKLMLSRRFKPLYYAAFLLIVRQPYILVAAQATILKSMAYYGILFDKVLHDNLTSRVRFGSA